MPVSRPAPYGHRTVSPTTVSLDRIRPRKDGGGYWSDNIQLVHVACNFVKLDFGLKEALFLVGRLGGQHDFQVDGDGMLSPPTEPRVDHATMSTVVIEAWAAGALVDRGNSMRHERELLTLEEIVRVTKPYMVTETTYRDPSGKELPLALASLDRIRPSGVYEEGNIRPLLTGLNMLRRMCVNDAPIIDYLKQITPEAVSRSVLSF